ncbi:thermostable alkaline protease [Colletotrichum nymphaeae SA-01]|uniref:Thermostable alkaline protease n=1 Tax=Colletotrichum nymphaeae SA-01 TaxID=1460502 RepID=A0A135USV5_9PEZI|nr:thermostable alkaline protease [Colletotrichum nymphaeae SA-01]
MLPAIPGNRLTRAGNGDGQRSLHETNHVYHNRSSSFNQSRPGVSSSAAGSEVRSETDLSIGKDQMPRGRSAEPTLRPSIGHPTRPLTRPPDETTDFQPLGRIRREESNIPILGDLAAHQKPGLPQHKSVQNVPKHSSIENRTNLSLQDFSRAIREAAKLKNDPHKVEEAAKLILDAMLWDNIQKLPRDNMEIVVARHHLGECYFHMGKYSEAEKLYREVLKARNSQKPPDPLKILEVRKDLVATLIEFARLEDGGDIAKAEKLNSEALALAVDNMNDKKNSDQDDDIDNVLHCTEVLLENRNRKPMELARLKRTRVRALVKIRDDMSDDELIDNKDHGIEAFKLFTVDLKDRKRGYEVYNIIESRIRKYGAHDSSQFRRAASIEEEVKDEWRKATGMLASKRWKKCLKKIRADVIKNVIPRKKEMREAWYLICRRVLARQKWQRASAEAIREAKLRIAHRGRLASQWKLVVHQVIERKKEEDQKKKRQEESEEKRKRSEERRKRDKEQKRLREEEEEEKKRAEETRLKRSHEEREQKRIEKDLMDKRKLEEQAAVRSMVLEEEAAQTARAKRSEDPEIQQGIRKTDTGISEWSEPEQAFFDAETELSSIQNSEKWMRDFIRSRDMILSTRQEKNMERVRVTIIDTGLDKTHPFVAKRQWPDYRQAANKKVALFQDFVTETPSVEAIDEDGHGTFIAGIMLQLAPLVELSIARVATTRASFLKDPNAEENVTKAINHAVEEWDTDIISMSLGFPRIKTLEFRNVIGKATWKNKILCAAAGNSGNINAHVPFPARLAGVFKIFAADHMGGKCSFSPRPGLDGEMCFSILGHDVVSIWPEALRDKIMESGKKVIEKKNPKKYPGLWVAMSGTSFATPIVASVVAILYQFYDANKAEIDLGPALEFKTVEAIRIILLRMCMAPAADQHNYLNPWVGRDNYFNFSGEERNTSVSFFALMLRLCLRAWNK